MFHATPAYHLAFDDPEGWEAFRTGTQTTFGFTSRWKKKASTLRPGDLLVCYLTGPSAWCGVLEVAPDVTEPDGTTDEQRANYPVRLPIRRIATLPTYLAIEIFDHEIWNGLSRTRGIAPRSRGWMVHARLRDDLTTLSPEDGRLLVDVITSRAGLPLPDGASDFDAYDPSNETQAREWADRQIVARRGQQTFREALITAYDGRCAISGCAVRAVLEAAHVTPYLGPRSNVLSNGLLLRSDLHTLWDCGQLAVDPASRVVIVDPALAGSEYGTYSGQRIRDARPDKSGPSWQSLQAHFDRVYLPRQRLCKRP